MDKIYVGNCEAFTKGGKYRKDTKLRIYTSYLNEVKPAEKDRENRKAVVNKIAELINDGVKPEDACKILAQDKELRNKFKYFPENTQLEQIFLNWYNGSIREKKAVEGYIR